MPKNNKKINPIEYIQFLNTNLTPHHFIKSTKEIAIENGFKEHINTRIKIKPGKYFIENGTMIFLVVVPKKVKRCAVVAVHIDSPVYKLNPNFIKKDDNKLNLIPLSISSYGGMLIHPWYDRELFIAGKIINKKGEHQILSMKELICLIPSLPPHLNNGTYTKEEFKYSQKMAFSSNINYNSFNKLYEESLSHDLSLLPMQEAFYDEITGYVYSGRQDNLSSSFAALQSIIKQEPDDDIIKIVAFYDYEEIGSLDRSGAHSISLSQIINNFDINPNISLIISADAAHAYNPLYSQNYEINHKCNLGDGIVIKYSPRYSTEINSSSMFNSILIKNKIKYTKFTNVSCIPGGGTVGSMISANTNIPTVDIGIPLLSMHSCREVTSIEDIYTLKEVFDKVFNDK